VIQIINHKEYRPVRVAGGEVENRVGRIDPLQKVVCAIKSKRGLTRWRCIGHKLRITLSKQVVAATRAVQPSRNRIARC